MRIERTRVGAALGAAVLMLTSSGWQMIAAAPAGAWAGTWVARSLADRERRGALAAAREELPLVLDRLSTCVLAGMSIERALRLVSPGTPGLLGAALADGVRAMEMGVARAEVYARIAERSRLPELHAVMAGIARAERFGTSVADALVAHADELRAKARAAAESEARTAPVKMLFPLVLCFLPAFVLLTIAPIALSAVRTLAGI